MAMAQSRWRVFYIILTLFILVSCNSGAKITDEDEARRYAAEIEVTYSAVLYDWTKTYYDYEAFMNDTTYSISEQSDIRYHKFVKELAKNASLFDYKNFKDKKLKSIFEELAEPIDSGLTEAQVKNRTSLKMDMEDIYGKAEVTGRPGHDPDKGFPLEPDLYDIMSESRDPKELLWAWEGWRNVSGRAMKEKYAKFVKLLNLGAKSDGYEDAGHMWRAAYDMEGDQFVVESRRLWNEVKPLYREMHTYVKGRLKQLYNTTTFPEHGYIPAHLLGNMWAQEWNKLYLDLKPYPKADAMDVTAAMKKQNYTARKIFEMADDFFHSLGMMRVPQSFWDHSILEKPRDGRDMVCHAAAWDLYNGKDFWIKQCTQITQEDFDIVHHEMGHIQYYMQYAHQSVVFKDGANPGFHEAVGDVISLSALTPQHMHKVGLLETLVENKEADINYLFNTALVRLAFLPFGYLIDQWRWDVFKGLDPAQYNERWWHYRYFISFILEFQFHEALCKEAGHTGPLYKCDIYGSKAAGTKFANMLKHGSSVPWPDALQELTGTRRMTSQSMVNYFRPLLDWLREQNKDNPDNSWPGCCDDVTAPPPTIAASAHAQASVLTTVTVTLLITYCL